MDPGIKPSLDQIVPIMKDLADCPESEFLLIMSGAFLPVDELCTIERRICGYRKGIEVVSFGADETGWIALRRSDLIFVPRTEIEEINAINIQRREELNKALHNKYSLKRDEATSPYGTEPPLDPRAEQDPLWFRGQAL